jgi:hypothetical protein
MISFRKGGRAVDFFLSKKKWYKNDTVFYLTGDRTVSLIKGSNFCSKNNTEVY